MIHFPVYSKFFSFVNRLVDYFLLLLYTIGTAIAKRRETDEILK